jgi:hypothetical protein
MNFSHILQTDINFYNGSHKFNSDLLYNLIISYVTKDNIRIIN